MQEHPEKYTDEQMERLLDDEEVKEFLRDLSIVRMAGKKAAPKKVDVDKAWKEFSNGSYPNRMKIAASVIGIIFLSGVAFAAVQNGWFRFLASDKAVDNNAVTEQIVKPKPLANESLKAMTSESKDSLDMKPVVFDNAELGTILTQWHTSIMSKWSMSMPIHSTFASSLTGIRPRAWSRTLRF